MVRKHALRDLLAGSEQTHVYGYGLYKMFTTTLTKQQFVSPKQEPKDDPNIGRNLWYNQKLEINLLLCCVCDFRIKFI